MAIESSTIVTTTEPGAVAGDVKDTITPALADLGVIDVSVAQALTGPMLGAYALNTRWETLDQWAAADATMAERMAAGGALTDMVARYDQQQRILASNLIDVGGTGRFVSVSRYSITSPPEGLDHAADLTTGAGANGLRVSTILAGGEMSGQLLGAIFVDSLDLLPTLTATALADAEYQASIAAAGAQLVSRTIFRML